MHSSSSSNHHPMFAGCLPAAGGDMAGPAATMRSSPITSLRIAANRPAVPLPTGGPAQNNMVRLSTDPLILSASRALSSSMSGTTMTVQQSLVGGIASHNSIMAGSSGHQAKVTAAAKALDPVGGFAFGQQHLAAIQSASGGAVTANQQQQQRYQELLSQHLLNSQRMTPGAGDFAASSSLAAVQSSAARPNSSLQQSAGGYRAELLGGAGGLVQQTLPRTQPANHQHQLHQQQQQFSNQECSPVIKTLLEVC